ncbi:NAD(P)-binding protein [Permianibacter sp. IMCC34836]|uniref:NAD(P)/FAD-dependent oxidoreductase n=1 Tax=Permianibacter fluminis TaxID=2738515 RepID=UPI00155717B8|nr:FAD-dependent oxidoreductase [Permianibacter fluminis]NQD36864.1 NAD(P)-binding protein [Permianibacter fluminis]
MKLAIIGGGISGLYAAWRLAPSHQVSVFEANNYVGGHTHTVDVTVASGRYAVDTGFIVCNDRTYPLFLQFLEELQVGRKATDMSFSVSCARSGLEYNGHNLNTLFAQRRNLLSPRFWKLLRDILRFNALAKAVLRDQAINNEQTLAGFLQQHGFAGDVVSHYLAPMTAAIWSTPLREVSQFPLGFFLQFCDNHGLLNVSDRPQWYVIEGGSRRYVEALLQRLPATVQSGTPVRWVRRHSDSVELTFADDRREHFDQVIFACHSDEALQLLTDPSPEESQVLAAIPYQESEVVLHTDQRLLPKTPRAWAAWNYLLGDEPTGSALPTLTYNMNMLQGIQAPETFCVTLNRSGAIAPEQVLGRYRYAHPQFSKAAVAAQLRHGEISGVRRSHYCGAYWGFGFHEDGVRSAARVVNQLQESR